jgi:geranylgeranyl pyrophosphate synthase
MHTNTAAAIRPLRPPQDNIPRTKQQRNKLLQIVTDYTEQKKPVGPLSLTELQMHSEKVIEIANVDPKYRGFVAVLVNNQVWRQTVAGIPFEKRLLLLPKCLRNQDQCQASFDELGLVCEHCGGCIIDELKSQAERLGYAVLIAEGSPVVTSLIETGKIEAVVGVSCLSVLQQVFPYMEAGAVPGIAIPLLQDGCANTSADIDWVWDAIYLNTDDQTCRLNLEDLHNQVDNWFSSESLEILLGPADGQTEKIALEWMAKAGKRWRPFLTACAYQALAENPRALPGARQAAGATLPDKVRRAAVAVECFHKASLIHDDIEDGDTLRYDQKTLHAQYGVPIALNVGDFLLGEGYRLLAELKVSDDSRIKLLTAAAQGHRSLCLGQGNELSWMRQPRPLGVAEVIDIFRKKTSPAFEVALRVGAQLSSYGDELDAVLEQYSKSLGIAYQIRDDIEDFRSENMANTLNQIRPSILLAMAYERTEGAEKKLLESIWNMSIKPDSVESELKSIFTLLKIERSTWELMENYKSQAIGSLGNLKNTNLKGLLRRVIGKIFDDFEVMGCCDDHKAGYAQGGKSGKTSTQ